MNQIHERGSRPIRKGQNRPSSDGKGFRLLGMVVSNKTDLVIEMEPHRGQVFPPARDYEALSRRPLQGAERVIAK